MPDNTDERFEDAVEWINSVPKFTKKNSIENVRGFIGELGIRMERFSFVHVAGSNGKGSVSCFLSCMLQKTGKRVGLFTSPHLVDMRERIRVDGQMCGKDEFLAAYDTVRETIRKMTAVEKSHPTFFEMLFAIALVVFDRVGAELVVLETGLGGRLDATNVIEKPIACVITPISLEHTNILGDTIEKIAAEKAGIIKSVCPVIYMDTAFMEDAQTEAAGETGGTGAAEKTSVKENAAGALGVIKKTADEKGAPLYVLSEKDVHIKSASGGRVAFYADGLYDKHVWEVPAYALYEAKNAALAIAAFGVISGAQGMIQEGLDSFRFPGRMDEIFHDVFLDGAHNPAGIEAFAETAEQLTKNDKHRPLLLFGMFADKDVRGSVGILRERVGWEAVAVCGIGSGRSANAEEISGLFKESTDKAEQAADKHINRCDKMPGGAGESLFRVVSFKNTAEAFPAMLRRKKDGQKLFCTGSLYLIGEIYDRFQRGA